MYSMCHQCTWFWRALFCWGHKFCVIFGLEGIFDKHMYVIKRLLRFTHDVTFTIKYYTRIHDVTLTGSRRGEPEAKYSRSADIRSTGQDVHFEVGIKFKEFFYAVWPDDSGGLETEKLHQILVTELPKWMFFSSPTTRRIRHFISRRNYVYA